MRSSEQLSAGTFQFFLRMFYQWSSAFEALLAELGEDISDRDRGAANVMKIWQLMVAAPIDIAVNFSIEDDDQTLWDNYVETYEKVVELAAAVFKRLEVIFGSHSNRLTSSHSTSGSLVRFTILHAYAGTRSFVGKQSVFSVRTLVERACGIAC